MTSRLSIALSNNDQFGNNFKVYAARNLATGTETLLSIYYWDFIISPYEGILVESINKNHETYV